jgi:pterin-4a-carbinolamine dehydratase
MNTKIRKNFSVMLRLSNVSKLRSHDNFITNDTHKNIKNYCCFFSSHNLSSSSVTETVNEKKTTSSATLKKKIMFSKDPLAKKPNSKCDPYGQGGKPLNYQEVSMLLNTTLEKGWSVNFSPLSFPIDNEKGAYSENHQQCNVEGGDEAQRKLLPLNIYKEFHHENLLQGTKFISSLASLCLVHHHFASFHLERRLMSRIEKNNVTSDSSTLSSSGWNFVTTVTCCTPTLGGLSYNDFHLAMMIDVECQKLKHLLLPQRRP